MIEPCMSCGQDRREPAPEGCKHEANHPARHTDDRLGRDCNGDDVMCDFCVCRLNDVEPTQDQAIVGPLRALFPYEGTVLRLRNLKPRCERCGERRAKYLLDKGLKVCNLCWNGEDISRPL